MAEHRKLLVGVDEAGYGPNLGPLAIVAISVEVPAGTSAGELWTRLSPTVSRYSEAAPAEEPLVTPLVVDDSKKLYVPGRSLGPLERFALSWAGLGGRLPRTLRDMCAAYCVTAPDGIDTSPWYAAQDIRLPHALPLHAFAVTCRELAAALEQAGFTRPGLVCQLAMPGHLNRLLERGASKSDALFQLGAELLQRLWETCPVDTMEVTLDKHGGRNFYGGLLQHAFADSFVLAGREGALASEYTVHARGRQLRACFVPRADAHYLLVAGASLVAKYLRELWMELFNAFWTRRIPGLRPTAGYPSDARRFWDEIESRVVELGFDRACVWRER